MLKKYSITALLLFAYTIVLAHSIIPHHHHDDHKMEQSSDHHHHGSDHNDNKGDEGLAHEFGNYMHSVNTTDVYQQPDTQFDQITFVSLHLFTTKHFIFKVVESSPRAVRPSHAITLQKLYCHSNKALRGPPCA